jgi:hypothetical protein
VRALFWKLIDFVLEKIPPWFWNHVDFIVASILPIKVHIP